MMRKARARCRPQSPRCCASADVARVVERARVEGRRRTLGSPCRQLLLQEERVELGPREGGARGVALSARSDTSSVNWFIGGEPLSDPENWIPQKPGFYQIEAVDANGDADTVIVQIVGGTVE